MLKIKSFVFLFFITNAAYPVAKFFIEETSAVLTRPLVQKSYAFNPQRLLLLNSFSPSKRLFHTSRVMSSPRNEGKRVPEKKSILVLSNKEYSQIKFNEHLENERLVYITTKNNLLNIPSSLKSRYLEIYGVEDYFQTGEVEFLGSAINEKHPIGHIVIDSEFDILRAAKLRELLRIPGQTYKSAMAFRDKMVMRNYIEKAGLKVAEGKAIDNVSDLIQFSHTVGFPFILKPRRGWGSEDVVLVDSREKLNEILSSKMFNASHDNALLAEKFIKGDMYFVEGVILDKKIIFSWPSRYLGTCLDLVDGKSLGSYILKPGIMADRLIRYAEKVLKALPIYKNTGFHLELFHTPEDEFIFCEIASRIGGGRINEAYKSRFHVDLRKLFIQMQADIVPNRSFKVEMPETEEIIGFVLFSSPKGPRSTFNGLKDNLSPQFAWMEQFYLDVKKGDVSSAKGLKSPFASAVIHASTEEEFQERVKTITDWVNTNTVWS